MELLSFGDILLARLAPFTHVSAVLRPGEGGESTTAVWVEVRSAA